MSTVVVQKYGGSVLRDDAAVRRVAAAVTEAVATGSPVVVVVSALAAVTDRHGGRAERFSARSGAPAVDLLLATGEIESASLLALALAEVGVPADALNPWQIGVHTDATFGGARIARVNPLAVGARLEPGRALVVPGFVGCSHDGGLTTLGRGGSDLTAVALAEALGAVRCEFVKDVPGYFSADPALVPHARHCPEVTFSEAIELARAGCDLLQERALERAASAPCRFSIRALDDVRETAIVGDWRGPPRVAAVTHARAGDRRLVSLVGDPRAIADAATAAAGALDAAGIPWAPGAGERQRLTFEVPCGRLAEALVLVHDRLFAVPASLGPES
jgi:aspartate kinase